MLNKIKQLLGLLKAEEAEFMQTPMNQEMVFFLTLKNLTIGELRLETDGIWTYQYSGEFRQQSRIKPLIDFPTSDKIYQADLLWPFFSSRIPTTNQPHVQDVVRRKHIDPTNTAEMLKEFGGRTITNPFVLQSARA